MINTNNLSITNQDQLELGLAGSNRCPRAARRERRLHHANWWFDQMRQIVDRAFELEPAPRFQLEQTHRAPGEQNRE